MIINCFKLVNDSEKDYYEAKTKPTGRKFVLDIFGCLNNTTFNYISNKSYDDLRLLENTILGSLPIAVEASAIFVNDIWKNICNVLWKDSEYKSYRMRALYAHVRNKVFRKYFEAPRRNIREAYTLRHCSKKNCRNCRLRTD